ncbi:Ankyrin repeat-containing protein [Glarea lozoyensis ATCC 20868]|uniref:Ankyrin repeat-containing protein n=1 Tax=Glarea lozoyensis (strain ATCC 20868 / MF5171) TaxID=1116229 RepID=S3DCX4_GLAL2|nr:Ankyrin repeat-containing protein [Glarea lozoyensis ATCC 20868]EPE29826.1 Ankyrin repeat-containing protein [Glarea lozoyensis ATCC 20868]
MSVLGQLLGGRPQLFQDIRAHYLNIKNQISWTTSDLWMILCSLITSSEIKHIIIVIDAVDRADRSIFSELQDLIHSCIQREACCKIVVTATEPPPNHHLPALHVVDLAKEFPDEIKRDVATVAERGIHSLAFISPEYKDLADKLSRQSQTRGRQLETALGLRLLGAQGCRSTASSIQAEIQSIFASHPPFPERLVDHVLSSPLWIHDCLFWILHSYRPLTLSELSIALFISDQANSFAEIEIDIPLNIRKDLIQNLGPIFSIQQEQVHLYHQCLKEPILNALKQKNTASSSTSSRNQRSASLPPIYSSSSILLEHDEIARKCLKYMSWNDTEKQALQNPNLRVTNFHPVKPHDFMAYAARYWQDHYSDARCNKRLHQDVVDFLSDETRLRRWIRARPIEHNIKIQLQCNMSPIHAASYLGLVDVVTTLLKTADPIHKEIALHAAAREAHASIFPLMRDDDLVSQHISKTSALGRHLEIVKILSNTNNHIGLGDRQYGLFQQDALQENVKGMNNLQNDIIHTLFSKYTYDELLVEAIRRSQLPTVRILLRKPDCLKLSRKTVANLLQISVSNCSLEIMRELLENNAIAAIVDLEDLIAALDLAAHHGHKMLFRELLAKVKRNGHHVNFLQLLDVAVSNDHVKIIEEIERAGEDVKTISEEVHALHLACHYGDFHMVEKLLGLGVDSSSVYLDKFTPLHLAAASGSLKIVQALLRQIQKNKEIQRPENPETARSIGTQEPQTGGKKRNYLQFDENHSAGNKTITGKLQDDGSRVIDECNPGFAADEESSTIEDPCLESEYNSEVSSSSSNDEKDRTTFLEDRMGIEYIDEPTALHSAAQRGHIEITKILIKSGEDYNRKSITRMTPLHLAARKGNTTIVKLILESGGNPNVVGRNNSSPLLLASNEGKLNSVKVLLKARAEVDIVDHDLESALHKASKFGYSSIVSLLLQQEADVDLRNEDGNTPLHLAAKKGHLEAVKDLFQHAPDFNIANHHGDTALHMAAKGQFSAVLRHVLENSPGININDRDNMKGFTALHWLNSDPECIKILKRYGADMEAESSLNNTALFEAVRCNSEEGVRALLECGAKPDSRNRRDSYPMNRAAQLGNTAIVKMLMDMNANPLCKDNLSGGARTPLQLAFEGDFPESVLQVLERVNGSLPTADDYGEAVLYIFRHAPRSKSLSLLALQKALQIPNVNLEITDEDYGQTPLSHAAEGGHQEIVEMLLAAGAERTSQDNVSGRTPLLWPVANGHETIVINLLEESASDQLDLTDKQSFTALHTAIARGEPSIIEILLDQGANIEARAFSIDLTPLAYAAAVTTKLEVVSALLFRGASLSALNQWSLTPLEVAIKFGTVDVVKAITEKGASLSTRAFHVSPLELAITYKRKDVGSYFMRDHAMVLFNDQGWAVLHLAAILGDVVTVRACLQNNPQVNSRDRMGYTPLHWAAKHGLTTVTKLLLDEGADVNLAGSREMTALHFGAHSQNEETLQIILCHNPDMSLLDIHGWNFMRIFQAHNEHNLSSFCGGAAMNDFTDNRWEIAGESPSCRVRSIVGSGIIISDDGLIISAENVHKTELRVGTQVRTDHPMPFGLYSYYFEITVQQAGQESEIGLGFCTDDSERRGMPGWGCETWGYNSDGSIHKWLESVSNAEWVRPAPKYSQNDTIGCGVDFRSRKAYFTKNGVLLGKEAVFGEIKGRLWPLICFRTSGAVVSTNLGGVRDFVFKESEMEVTQIYCAEPDEKPVTMMEDLKG